MDKVKTLKSGVRMADLDDLPHIATNYDMLFYHGTGAVSKSVELIEEFTRHCDKFSHVGVYTNPHLFPKYKDQLSSTEGLIFESTVDMSLTCKDTDQFDVITGKPRYGVQLRHATPVIKKYLNVEHDSYIVLSKLKQNPWTDAKNHQSIINLTQAYIDKYHNRNYEFNYLNLLSSAVEWLRPLRDAQNRLIYGCEAMKRPKLPIYDLGTSLSMQDCSNIVTKLESRADTKMLFCSEMAAMMYKMIKVISPMIYPPNIIPVDFLHMDLFDDPIYLVDKEQQPLFLEKYHKTVSNKNKQVLTKKK